jgi:hypothetical protein
VGHERQRPREAAGHQSTGQGETLRRPRTFVGIPPAPTDPARRRQLQHDLDDYLRALESNERELTAFAA